jgi:AcrR family transcriptional regulator
VDRSELPERDRILDAIAYVVSTEGFERATVEKIAERAGMSKSSLYFHFRNRSQMMASMLVPERERLIALVDDRVSEYADFSHRLYAFMVVTATYAAHSRTILTALDWMRFHRIRIHFESAGEHRPIFAFLEDQLSREDYAHAGLNRIEVSAYLHHLVMRPILEGRPEVGEDPESMLESVRLLYRFVVGGLVGKENEK